MTRRRKTTSKSGGSWQQVLLGLLVLLVLFAAQQFGLLDLEEGADDEGPSTGQERPSVETVGEWYQIYFTRPGNDSHWPEEELIAAVEGARERVWVASFDFDLEALAAAMVEAQARGVDVRLVVDADNEGLPAVQQLAEGEVPIQPDTREAFMHNKFMVVDESQSWAGSMNLTINDVSRNNNNFVFFRSKEMTENFAQEFNEMWNGEFGPTSTADTPHPHLAFGDSKVDVYFSPEDEPRLALLDVINGADSEIRFMAFSFTDEAVAEALIAAERRGVEVQGVFETFQAGNAYSQDDRLRNLDFDVRLDGNGGVMHHKVMIIDGQTVVTGSYNFTLNASRSNDETLMVLEDSTIAAAFLEEWERVWEQGKREE